MVYLLLSMYELKPTLWRTCRVLANEKRIALLFEIFARKECCVIELANAVHISESHASLHLRALSARGLIYQRRSKMLLLCSPRANEGIQAAPILLKALKESHEVPIAIPKIKWQATAFTHARRIEIVQNIAENGSTKDQLYEQTGISFSALTRHLNKLAARGFIIPGRNIYRRAIPSDPFSKTLYQLVCIK